MIPYTAKRSERVNTLPKELKCGIGVRTGMRNENEEEYWTVVIIIAYRVWLVKSKVK